MHLTCLCLVAFITASVVAYVNLLGSVKFGRFFFLIWASWQVISYSLIYGIFGVGLFLLLKDSTIYIGENNTSVAAPYMLAFVTGLSTKGISDVKFFDVRHGGQSFPIGFRTISAFIDNQFDREFETITFESFLVFMYPFNAKYEKTDIGLFKQSLIDALAAHPSKEKVAEFTTGVLVNATSNKELLEGILREFGRRTLATINNNVPAEL